MRLVANKPCTFGGKKFKIGEEVPAELVANPKVQAKRGVLTISDGEIIPVDIPVEELQECTAEVGQVKFCINIHAKEGELPVEATNEELQLVFDVLQENADDAKKTISEIESENVLILLDVVDSRKTVKTAIKERVDALFSESAESGENGGGE